MYGQCVKKTKIEACGVILHKPIPVNCEQTMCNLTIMVVNSSQVFETLTLSIKGYLNECFRWLLVLSLGTFYEFENGFCIVN